MKHELKIKPEYLAAINFGEKTFEIRNNADRNFQVGDTLRLKAWDGEFTGDFVEKVVSYITDFEQKPGYVVLGLVNDREHELLEKFHRTGVAIERAISTGSVLADHPLKSRLDLLANHHKREQELADGMVAMAERCNLLTDLLREATRVIPAIGVTTDDMPVVDAFLERIEDAVSGEDSHQTGITLSAADLVELADFCSPDRDTDPEQLETEIVLFYRRAFKSTDGDDMPAGVYVHLADYPEEGLFGPVGGRRLVGERPGRPDNEWTDATTSPVAADYRELQEQHDQLQSTHKGTLVLLHEAHEVMRRVIPSLPQDCAKRGDLLDRIEVALAGQAIGCTITEGQELELTTVLQSIANGFSDDPAHDAAALLKRIAGEVPWTGDSFLLPPRQAGVLCNQQHSLAGQVFAGLSAATALSVRDANSAADVVQLMLEAAEATGGEPCDFASPSSSKG
ncbi:ASCH/PUA domain-containing protein [Aeromonas caviae]|uniref:ASCH/PUA domain-containing protein n=1 Tax=Aeromonas caviae TaxID=648 RepID=UPI00301445AA